MYLKLHADKDVSKILYNLGKSMIEDDKSDLGWVTYKNRRLHRYHGRAAPDHASPVHHWMAGTLLCLIAQGLALVQTATEAQEVYQSIQSALAEEAPESGAAGAKSE